jgi:DNA (cytosine-5)-methyltransferase 3A
MKVLSLFDGISCAMMALKRNQIPVEYYASEVDKYAIKVSQKNHPEIVHLGSVVDLKPIPNLDLLIGGSPCQDLSIAKKDRKGLEGERSSLFWEYVRIWKESKPKWFILENVASMSKESKQKITEILQVEPIMINASLVSAQCRKRLFWTNIPVQGLPEDRNIYLKDILQLDGEIDERMTSKGKAFCLDASYFKGSSAEHSIKRKNRTMVRIKELEKSSGQAHRVYDPKGKSATLSNGGAGLIKTNSIRKLTPIECERLQGLPDNYTEGISNTQRYKCLGNAFNVDVICFILRFIN